MPNTKNTVRAIDPRLEFVNALRTYQSGGVYRVALDGQDYVLKFASYGQLAKELDIERNALRRVSNIPGVTHLIHDYGQVGEWTAILKEYADGKDLFSTEGVRDGFWAGVKQTIVSLHEAGVSPRDIHKSNIIASSDGSKGSLIDLGVSITADGSQKQTFVWNKIKDLSALYKLMKEVPILH